MAADRLLAAAGGGRLEEAGREVGRLAGPEGFTGLDGVTGVKGTYNMSLDILAANIKTFRPSQYPGINYQAWHDRRSSQVS